MLRRSRISVRPNVRPAGRGGPPTASQDATSQEATSQEALPPNPEAQSTEAPAEVKEVNAAAAVIDEPSVTPVETTTATGDANDKNGEGASCSTASSASLQRRKRFTVKPRVAPTLTRTSVRAPKSPVKAVSQSPVQAPVPDSEVPSTSSQSDTTVPQGLRSPGRRRLSGGSRQPRTQPKPSLPSPIPPGPTVVPSAEDPSEQTQLSADKGKQSECLPDSQAKEVPPKPPDKVHPSLPEKEAIDISERAKTLVSKSTKSGQSLPPAKSYLSRLLNDPADLQKMAKARKLRELLKQEMHKEKLKKAKARAKEYTLDTGKMTMRDLIYYLPNTNPMTSYLEETGCENETVIPPTPPREKSPERAQEPETHPEPESQREGEEEDDDDDDNDEEAGEDKDDQLMVPRVKVAEDGSLILDEESLTVEVQRAKGPNPADDRDPIFERGSTTTYSSFRKGSYTKPWSSQETDMFFLAISMVGTDFSMICQLFPHRARSEIKNKFKKEERLNTWRIDKAFKERRKLDLEFFSKLLEKILEVQKSKSKKNKSPGEKKAVKKRNRKPKEKKAEKKLSDVEEEGEDGELDFEEVEGEKENEDISNEGGTPAATPPKKRKRRDGVGGESSPEKPKDKKKKGAQANEQEEACVPEDAEAALPEDQPTVDGSEKTDESVNATKGPVIKPAQLSRGRAPKPLLQLGRKWGKKVPAPSTKPKDGAPATEEENAGEGVSKEQVSENVSPSRPAKEKKKKEDDDSTSEGEEDSSIAPPKPTRYGRMPKPIQHLNYPAKVDTHPSASETTPSSASSAGTPTSAAKPKPKPSARKTMLVTLRASKSESSDDEDEGQVEGEEMEEEQHPSSPYKDSSAPAFVPVGLRSPQPVVSVVEETMEEFDISVNVPDVLGISQDALCPDASCEQAQGTTGTVPCEHQLDLLVDVIDFLSSDPMEESEVSYNEAAQTLLTIGNLAHLSQTTQDYIYTQDYTSTQNYAPPQDCASAEAPFSSGDGTCSQDLQEDMVSQPVAQLQSSTTPVTETYDLLETEASQTVETFGPDTSAIDSVPVPQIGEMPVIETREETPSRPEEGAPDQEALPPLESSLEISEESILQPRRGRLPKVKPKPNLGRATRTAQSKSQPTENPITSPVKTAEEIISSIIPSDISRVTQPLQMVEESISPITDSVPASQAGDTPTTKITPTEDPSVIQEKSANAGPVPQIESGSEISEQSAPQNRRGCFTKIKPNLQRSTRTTQSKPQSTDETLESPVRTTEDTSITPPEIMTSDSAVVESQSVVEESITITSVPGHQSSDHPATAVTPIEEESASKADGSEAGPTSQTSRSRFSKIKPKPNLGRASRTLQSNSQHTEDTATHSEPIKTPSSPTLKPQSTESINTFVEPQQITESIAPQPPSCAPASASVPSFELCSTRTPTEESSTSEEQRTEAYRVDSSLEDSEKKVPRIRRSRFPKAKPKPNLGLSTRTTRTESQPTEDTNKLSPSKLMESSSNASSEPKPIADNNKHSELESVEKASRHLTPPQSTSKTKHPSSEAPEPERSSEETAPGIITADPVVTETSVLIEDPFMMTESVPEPQSSDKSTTGVAQTVQMSSNQGKTAEAASTSQVASISEQNVPQTRRGRFSKIKPKPNLGQATRITQSIPQPTEDTFTQSEPEVLENTSNTYFETQPTKDVDPHLEPQIAENSSKRSIPLQSTSISKNSSSIVHTADPVSLSPSAESNYLPPEVINADSVVAETSWVIEDPFMVTDSVPEIQSSEMPSAEVTPIEEPFTSEKKSKGAEAENVMQVESDSEQTPPLTRRGRISRVKPKPSLGRATRIAHSKPQPAEDSATHSEEPEPLQTEPQPSMDTSPFTAPKPAENASEHSLPQYFAQPTEQQIPLSSDEAFTSVPESQRLTEEITSETVTSEPVVTESSWLIEDPFLMDESEDREMPLTANTPTEKPSSSQEKTEIGSALQKEPSSEQDVLQTRKSRLPKVKPKPNLKRSTRTTESKPQSTEDTATILEPPSTKDGLKPSLTTSTHSKPGAKVHIQPSCSENTGAIRMGHSEVKGHDASREQLYEDGQHKQSNKDDSAQAQRAKDTQSGASDSDQFSKKALQTRSARLPKPKPNLGSSTRTTRTESQPTEDTNKLSPSKPMESSSNASSEPPKPIADNNKHSELESVEKASRHLTPPQSTSKTKHPSSEAPEPERSSEETAPGIITADPVVTETSVLIEDPFMMTESVPEPQSSDKSTTGVAQTVQMSSNQGKTAEAASTSQVASISEQNVPQTRRGHFSKIKPKPNLGRATRITQSIPQPTEDTFTQSEPEVLENTSNTYFETQPTKDVDPHLEPQIAENSSKRSVPLQSTSISENSSSIVHTAVPVSLSPSAESNYLPPEVINSDSVVAETSWVIEDPFMVTDSVPEIQSSEMPSAEVTPIEEPFTSEKKSKGAEAENVMRVESDSEQTPPLTRRGRISRVKPKPSLGRATRIAHSKPQHAEDSATHSEDPEPLQTEPQPSMDVSPSTAPKPAENASKHSSPQYSAQPTEQQIPLSSDEAFTLVPESRRLTEEITSETVTSEPVVAENSWLIEDPFFMDESEDREMPITANTPTEKPSSSQEKTEVESALQKEPSSEQDVPQTSRSRLPKVKPKPNLKQSTRTTESKPQSTEDTATILEPPSTKDGLKPSLTTSTHSKLGAKVHIQPSCSKNTGAIRMDHSEVKGHDASREQLYEDGQHKQLNKDDSAQAQCAEDTHSGSSHSDQFSKKAPQTRRARLPKPKPNLSRRTQPAVRNTTQPEPEVLEDSASQMADCKPISDIQEPVDGASDTSTAPICITQIPVDSIQDITPPGAVESQHYPFSTINPDVPSEQVPSEPEEPFFILSLTEIPVSPSGGEMCSVSQPLPYFPTPDAPIQLQSAPSPSLSDLAAPGGNLAVAGVGALPNVLVPISMKEGEEKRSTSVEDVVPGPASPVKKSPEDPHEMAEAQLSKLPEAVESRVEEEMDLPHKKRRVAETRRRAKLQVKPKTACRKQPGRTTTAEEAELTTAQMHTTQESELTDLTAQPEISGTAAAGDGVTSSGGSATDDSTSGAETLSSGLKTPLDIVKMTSAFVPLCHHLPGRRPKGFLSFISSESDTVPSGKSQQAKAASQVPQVNASRAGRKRAAPAPISPRVAPPTPKTTPLPEATPSTSTATKTTTRPEADVTETSDVCRLHPDPEPSTSSFITEVPAVQQVESVDMGSADEEPTNISQFFFSDIITEVDEND